MARILCAWSPNWAIANWRRRNPSDSPPSPFGLIETVRAVRRLSAVDKAATAAGLFVGQKATDAMALIPDLITAEAEPEADARALAALVDWCVRFSPAVAPDSPDGVFLDITGVTHLWGGEAELMADFRGRLAGNGIHVRCAVADTPGAAWALAHHGKGVEILAPPNGHADLLAYLPPTALRLDPAAAAQMERLGLRLLCQMIGLPRAPFARRFGAGAMLRLDQAMGRAEEALVFRRPPNPWFARLAFFEPISTLEDLDRVTGDVAVKLCARLEREGRGAKRFEIAFHRVDGRMIPLSIGLSLASRDPVRIAKLFKPKLETVDPGFGIEVVTIMAQAVELVSGRQVRLDTMREAALEDGLAPLVDRLANRLGDDRVWKARPVQSHIPEQSSTPAPALVSASESWNPETPRPMRLFLRPEVLEFVTAPYPDDPPGQFRWRKRLHRVVRAEGPERIGAEWWRERDIDDVSIHQVRDYYRVEDHEGSRFWVYREGLENDGQAKWFVHGLFG